MRRIALLAAVALGLVLPTAALSAPKTICVGKSPCVATLAAAVAAANDGDTIQIQPGTYAGGVEIDKSINLVGAGAFATILKGGGPVLAIGNQSLATEPTVSIRGVTVTGGLNTSLPNTTNPFGGGIFVAAPLGPDGPELGGGSVSISDSVITGNRVTNSATVDFGIPCPGNIDCPGADPQGGGIAAWENLTLTNTVVSNNVATSPDFWASGGGIEQSLGSLTLIGSTVIGNTASATAPYGLHAYGGGIDDHSAGTITLRDSSVVQNTVSLVNNLPYSFDGGQTLDEDAHGGGVTAGNDSTLTVANSHIDRNSITVATPNGEAFAFASGLCLCTDDQTSSTLTVSNASVSGNSLNVTVASQADVFPGSGDALELDGLGTVSNTQVTGNVTTVRASSGDAIAGPAGVETADGGDQDVIANSLIAGNTATAIAPHGKAWVLGGGLVNQGPLLLQDDLITLNRGIVSGQTEVAQGGGIYNGATWFQGGLLTLQNTTVIGNVLSGDNWATLQGGGLFSTSSFPVTLTHSLIAHNAPDNCVGTGC